MYNALCMQYAVCEISGRQYLVKPGQTIEVDKLNTEDKTLSVEKVLLLVEGSEVKIGAPYLKENLSFEVLGNVKKAKVRVATFHAKANYRRVKGQRREMTRIKLVEEQVKAVKKSVKRT